MIKALRLSETELFSSDARISFEHNNKKGNCSAYELTEHAVISLTLPIRFGVTDGQIDIYDESFTKLLYTVSLEWNKREGNFDIYNAKLNIKEIGVGLYFAKISINNLLGKFYAHKHQNKITFKESDNGAFIQFSVSDFKYGIPKNLLGGAIYHIFVDRFAKSGNCKLPPGSVGVEWDAELPEYPEYPGARVKNNYFYGGDLYGIISKLDYLKNLGVRAIYLSPIFKSPSNHKYDTADYMSVDEGFGGDEALQELIKKARAKGIGVILDGVFNHTGADSVYFNKFGNYPTLGAYQSPDSQYFSWYDFHSFPEDYTAWWGVDILPRINPDLKECRAFFTNTSGVIDKYAKMGILGFRLDVVDELSDDFVSEIKAKLNELNSESVLYGEVWEDASNKIAYGKRKKYYLGTELDGVMNYPLRSALISYFKNGRCEELCTYLYDILPNMPVRVRNLQMNLLGSHDTERILTALGGESSVGKSNSELLNMRMSEEERKLATQRLKMAYTVIATLPGIPTIYYGDEAGMEGYADPFSRRTFPWGHEDKALLFHYKKIANIRKAPLYKDGELKIIHISKSCLIFERKDEKQVYLTVVNNSAKDIKLKFSKKVKAIIKNTDSNEITLPAMTVEIINTMGAAALQLFK